MRSPHSLFQAKQAQFPQPFLIGELLQPSDHLSGPPLDLFQEFHIFLVLGAPSFNIVLQIKAKEIKKKYLYCKEIIELNEGSNKDSYLACCTYF